MKNKILALTTVIAITAISIAYIGTITPLQAQTYNFKVEKKEPVKEMSIKECVWELLTVEGGLPDYEAAIGMLIVKRESSWDKEAEQYLLNDRGVDRGLWQINSYHQAQVSGSCAYDVYCSTREAIKIYKKRGNNWSAWSTYYE